MIFGKFWRAISAQINKLANYFWTADPIAQMQYEYDKSVEEMKGGRQGLEQYRGLVERVSNQVAGEQRHIKQLESCLLYTSPSPRDQRGSRMPSSA